MEKLRLTFFLLVFGEINKNGSFFVSSFKNSLYIVPFRLKENVANIIPNQHGNLNEKSSVVFLRLLSGVTRAYRSLPPSLLLKNNSISF